VRTAWVVNTTVDISLVLALGEHAGRRTELFDPPGFLLQFTDFAIDAVDLGPLVKTEVFLMLRTALNGQVRNRLESLLEDLNLILHIHRLSKANRISQRIAVGDEFLIAFDQLIPPYHVSLSSC